MRFRISDFTLVVHTLDNVSPGPTVLEIARHFRDSFGLERVDSQMQRDPRKPDRWIDIDSLDNEAVSRWPLTSVFVDQYRELASLSIDAQARPSARRQNLIVVRLTRSFLSRPTHLELVRDWLCGLTRYVQPTFGLGYESDAQRFDFRMHPELGLEAGLPGVFLTTVLGPPFLDVVGRERLLKTPSATVFSCGGILVISAVPSLLDYDYADFIRTQHAVRGWIGEQFFDVRPATDSGASGASLVDVARSLFGFRRTSSWKAAQVAPRFT